MTRNLNSFKVSEDGKVFDYRLGKKLDLDKIRNFFQKTYHVEKLWQGARHILGILTKNGSIYFLKLSTTEGISIVTRNEYEWNNYFNNNSSDSRFRVPKNYESGLYDSKYFYMITDYFDGELICVVDSTYEQSKYLTGCTLQIIEFFELIQKMPPVNFTSRKYERGSYKRRFVDKAKNWFNDIPADIRKKAEIKTLLDVVEKGCDKLLSRPRHGDFTPWHIIKLKNSRLGLIDGEHALQDGVEGYDICYFIQRVFSVLKNPQIAKDIYLQLKKKGYETNKLKTVFAARAIGGFLDESLINKPDYKFANNFKDWILKI